MRFESEKQRKVRERQRMKLEKEMEAEQSILRNLKNNSRVVTRKKAEEMGVRMYDEAHKRNNKKIVEFMLISNRHKTKVYNFTLQMLRDADTTEDVVQNVFMKLFENLNNI